MEEDNYLVVSDTDLSSDDKDHEQNANPNPPPTRSNLFLLRTPIQSPNGTPSKKKKKKKKPTTTTTNTSTASPIQLVQSQADNADNSGGTPTKKRRKKRKLKHTNNGGDIGDDAPHMLHLNSPPNPNPNTDAPPDSASAPAPANVIVNAKKKKKKPNNNGDNVDHALMPINCSTESPVEDVQNNNNNTTPTHALTSEVMGYLKHIVKVDQDYERFEATYPFLNNVLEREGGKTLFMEKLLSVEKSELDQMESEFKNISLMQLEARKRGTQVILKLHAKWLGE